MTFKDKTFCASPNCTNECGRKMTEDEKTQLEKLNNELKQKMSDVFFGKSKGPMFLHGVSYGYFCGEPEDE